MVLSHVSSYHGSYRDRFAFTHVCQQWRNVALDNPSLWTYVVVKMSASIAANAAILSRSGTAPLHVQLDMTQENSPLFKRVLAEAHRFRSLYLYRSPSMSRMSGTALELVKAPKLECFIYHVEDFDRFPMGMIISAARSLKELQWHGMPELVQVQTLPTFAHLDSLAIEWSSVDFDLEAFCGLLVLLKKTSNLKHLELSTFSRKTRKRNPSAWGMPVSAEPPPGSVPTPDDVDLPSLRTLKIVGSFDYTEDLLDRLRFPIDTRLSFSYYDHDIGSQTRWHWARREKDNGSAHFLNDVVQDIEHPLHRADIRLRSKEALFTAWNKDDDLENPAIKLLLYENLDKQKPSLALQIYMNIHMDTLKKIKIGWNHFNAFDASVLDVLGTLDQLHTIDVEGAGSTNFIYFFVRLVSDDQASFPALRYLTLSPIELTKFRYAHRKRTIDLLIDTLASRPHQQLAKLHLGVENAGIERTWIERLKTLVDVLEVTCS
jgi:hypothetical protein